MEKISIFDQISSYNYIKGLSNFGNRKSDMELHDIVQSDYLGQQSSKKQLNNLGKVRYENT
jgi:hypothetical protein